MSGYPTIKIVKKGEPVDYEGARTEQGRDPIPPTPKLMSDLWFLIRVCNTDVHTCRSDR